MYIGCPFGIYGVLHGTNFRGVSVEGNIEYTIISSMQVNVLSVMTPAIS